MGGESYLLKGVIKSCSRHGENPENRIAISTYSLAFNAGFSGKIHILIIHPLKVLNPYEVLAYMLRSLVCVADMLIVGIHSYTVLVTRLIPC